MKKTKEDCLKAYHNLVNRTLKPFKESMTEEEFKQFRYEHTVDEFLNDYEYTFDEEVGYWLENGDKAYNEYVRIVDEKKYKVEVANELKRICETEKSYKYYLEICDRQNHVLIETKYFNKFIEVINFYNTYINFVDKGRCRIYIMQQDYYADADEYGDSRVIDVFE